MSKDIANLDSYQLSVLRPDLFTEIYRAGQLSGKRQTLRRVRLKKNTDLRKLMRA